MTSETDHPTRGDGSDETEGGSIAADPSDVTDTFTLLSNETRVRIVLALDDAPEDGLRFSELRARVGIGDAGLFNYHLERLRGRLMTKSGNGYVLTPAGERAATLV